MESMEFNLSDNTTLIDEVGRKEIDDIERRNRLITSRRKDSIEKLKSIDNLLAYHYLLQKLGIQNPYGSDTSLLTSELNITFKEAEELVKRRNFEIKPKGWKLGNDYDTSKLDKQVENALKEINAKYDAELGVLEAQITPPQKQQAQHSARNTPNTTLIDEVGRDRIEDAKNKC